MASAYLSWLDDGLHWLQLMRHELMLFAAFWFIVGAIDELAIDIGWFWLRCTGRGRSGRLPEGAETSPLSGRAAVFVPAWLEADVIGAMIAHTLRAWVQHDLTLYVGCYRNDPATLAAALSAAGDDPRLRLVVHDRDGPTTKADCLNRLYAAICEDEARSGVPFRSVVLQDAEDMVHRASLAVIDGALAHAEFVQLPVQPELQADSPWVGGHYADEFIDKHTRAMVVRDSMGAAIPAAGVGCGFSRAALAELARKRQRPSQSGPFSAECLTEDYELGLLITRNGGRGRFLRLRDGDGALVATRAYFPGCLDEAVRQKTRWIHGIALQGWDRLGWSGRLVDNWMALRDRRGMMTALVLAAAYLLIVVEALLALGRLAGHGPSIPLSPQLRVMISLSFATFLWRALLRFGFTAREYGLVEGIRGVLRIPVANVIAIMAGRRALFAYVRSLGGGRILWDKTEHRDHPAEALARTAAS